MKLSDFHTHFVHTHGNITNDGKIGSSSNLPIITGPSGIIQTGSFGTSENTFAEGNHNHSLNSLSGSPSDIINAGTNLEWDGDTLDATDTTYIAGSGIILENTTFSLAGDTFLENGDYGDLRARATTKDDVGLGNVPNTDIAYSSTIPADAFTSNEVRNLRDNQLADGSTPWTSNNHYDDSDVDSHLSGGTGIDYNSGTITNTDTGSSAVSSHESSYNHSNFGTAYDRSITGVSGDGNSTLTINRQGADNLTTDLSHTHDSIDGGFTDQESEDFANQ